jgi:hypothetical protein
MDLGLCEVMELRYLRQGLVQTFVSLAYHIGLSEDSSGCHNCVEGKTRNLFDLRRPSGEEAVFAGCEQNLKCTRPETIWGIFGVGLVQRHGNEYLKTRVDVSQAHALWGERGIDFGVAAYTNHIEGTHGRLKHRVRKFRSLIRRFVETTLLIVKSATRWSQKGERGWNKTKKKLEVTATSMS